MDDRSFTLTPPLVFTGLVGPGLLGPTNLFSIKWQAACRASELNNVPCGSYGGSTRRLTGTLGWSPLSGRPCQCSSPSRGRERGSGGPPAWAFPATDGLSSQKPRGALPPTPHYSSTPRAGPPQHEQGQGNIRKGGPRPAPFLFLFPAPVRTPRGLVSDIFPTCPASVPVQPPAATSSLPLQFTCSLS